MTGLSVVQAADTAATTAPVTPRPTRRRRRGRAYVLRVVAAVVCSLVMVAPLYWMVVVALSPRTDLLTGRLRFWPGTLTLANFRRVLSDFPIGTWFVNSLDITVATVLITVTVSLLAGYALVHLRFRGRSTVFFACVATLMVPVQVIMVAQFRLITDLSIYATYWAVILPTAGSAFGMFLARQFMFGVPRDLIEAARIDGAGHLRVFVSVVLPLCKPLIAVLATMSTLSTWNDFAWPLIALKQNDLFTLPIGLLYLQGQFGADYGAIMAFALLSVLPMIALFLVFQRYLVQGFANSGLR